MLPEVACYLREVQDLLHLDPRLKRLILAELRTYFQEKVHELQSEGFSEREATRLAIECCGRPRVIARRMYEAYSHGSLAEAACASLPHLIVAFLFAGHLWLQPAWSIPAVAGIAAVTVSAWWNGRPSWLYPWIGYSLSVLLVGGWVSRPVLGHFLAFLLDGGSAPNLALVLLVLTFSVLSASVIAVTTVRVARRDWLLASLMLVPLPLVGGWLASLQGMHGFFQGPAAGLHGLDGEMSLALVALAFTSAGFVLVRQRVLKIGGLAVVGTLAAATVGHSLWGEHGLFGLLSASFLLLLLLLIPAIVRAFFREEDLLQIAEPRTP
ncbi:MAG: hypothetical protein ABR978_06480 [Dehalococcoidia bacterium]|jgi:hypothetical protein